MTKKFDDYESVDLNQLIENLESSDVFLGRSFDRTQNFYKTMDNILETDLSFLYYGQRQSHKTTTMLIGLVSYALERPNNKIVIVPVNHDNIINIIESLLINIPHDRTSISTFQFKNGTSISIEGNGEFVQNDFRLRNGRDIDILYLDEVSTVTLDDLSHAKRILGTMYFPSSSVYDVE